MDSAFKLKKYSNSFYPDGACTQHLRMRLTRPQKNSKYVKILNFIRMNPNCTKWDIQRGLSFPYNKNYVFPGWQLINVLKEKQLIEISYFKTDHRKAHYNINNAGQAFLEEHNLI